MAKIKLDYIYESNLFVTYLEYMCGDILIVDASLFIDSTLWTKNLKKIVEIPSD